MKINKKLCILITVFLCSLPVVANASSYYGVVSGAGVRIRKSTSSTAIYRTVSSGEILNVLDPNVVEANDACPNGWYKVDNSGNTGYICSNYLRVYEKSSNVDDNTAPTNECEAQMAQAGFPSSYWSGLCSLKQIHPNWEFNAVSKDGKGNAVDWNMSVNAEASCGMNTISSGATSAYKDPNCTRTTDAGYSNVTSAAVRYYMDPRNFLNEVNIFMFEGYRKNDTVSADAYKTASAKIFGNSFLVQQIPNLPSYIQTASDQTGVSQTAIASRIKQELGNAKLTSGNYSGQLYSVVSGNYTTRFNWYYNNNSVDNYYNFFNIGAYDGDGVTQKALIYAFNQKWGGTGNQDQDRQIAVTGGAQFLNNKYVNAGQDTAYFQKFNIFPTNATSRYLNQYMTNIEAPVGESKILYNAYKDADMLNSSFKFYIPVFQGMNNAEDNSLDITSNPETNGQVAAETAITSAGLRNNNGFVANIQPGTNIDDLRNNLANYGNVSITDDNGNPLSGNIGTGARININGVSFIAVIYGDVSGDGEINALDLLKIQKSILETSPLNGSYKEAADPSKDGQVNALDLLKVQKKILGSADIEQ